MEKDFKLPQRGIRTRWYPKTVVQVEALGLAHCPVTSLRLRDQNGVDGLNAALGEQLLARVLS